MSIQNFPVLSGLIYPVKRAPVWSTIKQAAISGRRTRLARYAYPDYQYTIGYSMLRSDNVNLEWQTLMGFYNQMNGPVGVFNWADQEDFQVTNQDFGLTDGTAGPFQLVRTLGGFDDPVFQPALISSLMVAGVPTSAYTVNNYGQITFTGTPPTTGQQLSWTGTYVWLAQFDDDMAEFENFMYHFWELKQIKFTTWRP